VAKTDATTALGDEDSEPSSVCHLAPDNGVETHALLSKTPHSIDAAVPGQQGDRAVFQ
jgi:hypothetical protein